MNKRLIRGLKKINTKYLIFISKYRKDLIATYWYDRIVNFGDLLSPVLLRHYGFTAFRTHQKRDAKLLCVGSVLDDLTEDYGGYILGSGLLFDSHRRIPGARILAVRGDLTRLRIGAPSSTILGDPGLLADRLLPERQEKQYRVGIVPHYVDKNDARLEPLKSRYKDELLLIDVQRDPIRVITDIDRCEFILSSSLHGIITADALGIPNAWLVLSEKLLGNDFKFQDYVSAFGEQIQPKTLSGGESLEDLIGMTHKVSGEIFTVKANLDAAFLQLKKEVLLGEKR